MDSERLLCTENVCYFYFGLDHPDVSGVLRLARNSFTPDDYCDADVSEQQHGERYAVLKYQQCHVIEMPDVLTRPRFVANVHAAFLTN